MTKYQESEARLQDIQVGITKTCLCNVQRFFSAVNIENFVKKIRYF